MITLDESSDLFTKSLNIINDKEFFIKNIISKIDLDQLKLTPYFISFNIKSEEFIVYKDKGSDFGERLGNITISSQKLDRRLKYYDNSNEAIYDWFKKAYFSQQAILSQAYLGNIYILESLVEKNKFPKIILEGG